MGPTVINGLPAHVLLVHIVVVFVPLAAILTIVSALWPAARRRLGILTPITALIALASIPPTTHAGEWLIQRVGMDPELQRHADLADTLLPIVSVLFLFAAALWVLFTKPHWFARGTQAAATTESPRDPAPVQAEPAEGNAATATMTATAERVSESAAPLPSWLPVVRIVVAVLAIVVAVGAVVDVVLIGDAGAKSVWSGTISATPGQ